MCSFILEGHKSWQEKNIVFLASVISVGKKKFPWQAATTDLLKESVAVR